ncbi:hypothetical protein D3C78_1250690 [compost metagenome]
MGINQARYLHRQRAAAGNDLPVAQVLPGGTGQRQWIDAGVPIKPTVFIGQQRLQIIGRDLLQTDRIAPYAVTVRIAPQRGTVFRHHHSCHLGIFQRQRPQPVRQPQQNGRQQNSQQPDGCPAT